MPLPDSAVEFRKFIFVAEAEPLSDGYEIFSEDSICKCSMASLSPVAISIEAELTDQWVRHLSRMLIRLFFSFFCFYCLPAGWKSQSLAKSLNFSPTVCLVYFLTLFVQYLPHWSQKLGWRLRALEFPEFLEECITYLINYKKKYIFKKLTTFKFGKCVTFLNGNLFKRFKYYRVEY